MKLIYKILATALAMSCGTISHASDTVTPENTLNDYCERLVSGASATTITEDAEAAGFEPTEIFGHPYLVFGPIVLGVSDNPRVCLVQASPEMTFAQGKQIADRWASRHPNAKLGPERGPDGARIRAWSASKENRHLVMTEQTAFDGRKVVAFILMPLP